MGIVLSVLILALIYFLKTKKVSFGNRVLLALVLGVVIGSFFQNDVQYIQPIGGAYVNLIKALVVPLVVSVIITSITALEDPARLKKIGLKTLGWFFLTTAIAAVIGTVIALAFNLGDGVQFVASEEFKAREIPTFSQIILDLIPANPVSEAASGKIIPVMVFSIIVAVAIIVEGHNKPELVKPVKDFFKSFSQIMFRVTRFVMQLTPYAIFALMAQVSAKYGISSLLPLIKVIGAVYLASIIQIVVVQGGLIAFVAKLNPVKFFKKIFPAQLVAFTTRSSYGTLPVTIKTLTERVKVSEELATFIAPLGANMGMNGCAGLYPAIVAVFVAKVFNIPMDFSSYLLLIGLTTVASIGTAGVPGTASIMATVVLSGMGLPIEGLALVLGVDTVIDMARTATNVTGAAVVSTLVAASENELDRAAFEEEDKEFELSM